MRIIFIIISFFLFSELYSQKTECQVLIDSAKNFFNREQNLDRTAFDQLDYRPIINILNDVLKLEPTNTEGRYLLGYAYSRMNSRDARTMASMNLELVMKSSEQFEKLIQLSPKYNSELVILDPYTKIASEWGSMAMTYLYNHKPDSAIWAFKEGKVRGGFGEFVLAINRKILAACKENAILFTSGDIYTIPLWYLQEVEGCRKDVSIIDINLLNTFWYTEYLSENKKVEFDIPSVTLDSAEVFDWADSAITMNDFTWIVKPTYYEKYILRGDRLFLSILQQNNFEHEICFTTGFNENSQLGLHEYLSSSVIVDKLFPGEKQWPSHNDICQNLKMILTMSELLNFNSTDELLLFDNYRYFAFNYAYELINNNEKSKAKEIIEILDTYANEKIVPYQNEDGRRYMEYFKSQLNSDRTK